MAILLDETTRAEYLAQSIASTRASLVVGALSGTVVVEVYDGFNVLRASGTMASPWATSSSATITIGEVNAAGLTVTSGGAPTADWYCQFRSGTRFVRGTFGVLGSGRDFVWSLSSFETGSRGTIGTVTLTAQGLADPLAPTLLAAPVISGATQVGSTISATTGTWANTPTAFAVQWQRASTAGGTYSNISGAATFSYTLAAGDQGFFIRAQVTASNATGSAPPAVSNVLGAITAPAAGAPVNTALPTVFAFRGTVTTVGSILHITPGSWQNELVAGQYPIQRNFGWQKDGVDVAVGLAYTPEAAGVYRVWEEVYFPATPTARTRVFSNTFTVSGTRDSALVYKSDLEWLGVIRFPEYNFSAASDFFKFNFGGVGLALNPTANTLVSRGHPSGQLIGEFTIPTVSATLPPDGGTEGVLVGGTSLFDPLEGQTVGFYGVDGDGEYLEGMLVNGTRVIMAMHSPYSNQPGGVFVRRPLARASTGQIEGPFTVFDAVKAPNPRRFTGMMANVPAEHQSALGGNVLSGLTAGSIVSNTSDGPSLISWNTSSIDTAVARTTRGTAAAASSTSITLAASASSTTGAYVGDQVTIVSGTATGAIATITAYNGTTKVATVAGWSPPERGTPAAGSGYVVIPNVGGNALATYNDEQLQAHPFAGFSGIWNWNGYVGGIAVPNGTRAVLCFGEGGDGIYYYGSHNVSLGAGQPILYDPVGEGQGEHSFPYNYRVWAYDVNELAAVRAGSVTPGGVRPYAVFNITVPFGFAANAKIRGAAYDPATRRVYLSFVGVLPGSMPLIHVFRVNNAVAA